MDKLKIDVPYTVNMAIRFVKDNPCVICSLEDSCKTKYKGTCIIWRELKARLIDVKEMEAEK